MTREITSKRQILSLILTQSLTGKRDSTKYIILNITKYNTKKNLS